MAAELTEKAFREQLAGLCPTVDNLQRMLGAARHAFNHNSPAELETLTRLREDVILELDPFFENAETALKRLPPPEKTYWLRLHGILTRLELISVNIINLEKPIRIKIKDNVIFSDPDFMYFNHLFTQHTALMRALVDVFKQDQSSLGEYGVQESEKLIAGSFAATAAHESHALASFGQPRAWSVYLSMLDYIRAILRHLIDIIKLIS